MDPTFTHVRVLVDEYEACFRFYRDVLGFEPTFGDATSGYADFDTGDVALALFDADEMAAAIDAESDGRDPDGSDRDADGTVRDADGTVRDDAMLVLAVDDVDAAAAQVEENAAVVAPPADHPEWGIRTVHVRDPDGTLVELNEPLEN